MGFQEQLNEIIHRIPESRQTVLFSATLPKLLVEFAKAGLHDPTLLRLDVETKLSEQLKVILVIFYQMCIYMYKMLVILLLKLPKFPSVWIIRVLSKGSNSENKAISHCAC